MSSGGQAEARIEGPGGSQRRVWILLRETIGRFWAEESYELIQIF